MYRMPTNFIFFHWVIFTQLFTFLLFYIRLKKGFQFFRPPALVKNGNEEYDGYKLARLVNNIVPVEEGVKVYDLLTYQEM